jgi:prepilin-type N-terminal cleavage/methylation domain-containing protein
MNRKGGFTLIEMLITLVIGSILVSAVFRLWQQNRRASELISSKGDFRDRATLATTQLNRSITMAGFGMTRMDVLRKGSGTHTDTLVVYSNDSERRTTLMDTARSGQTVLRVFKDSGFAASTFLGITDSLNHEYRRVARIAGNAVDGFEIHLTSALSHTYLPGVPDIYPVQRERFFADVAEKSLVRYVDDRRIILAGGVTEFRVQLLTRSGAPASLHRDIRVVTFSLTGQYKAPQGMPSSMSFSSTVIPRNIL